MCRGQGRWPVVCAVAAGLAVWLGPYAVGKASAQPQWLQLKWSQPPVEWDPNVQPPVYHGWDELSLYPTLPGLATVAADDWLCRTLKPVVAVRWWGSFQGWSEEYPPPIAPTAYHIGFWTNVPVGPDDPFSHPGRMVHEITVPVGIERLDIQWVGYDQMPDPPGIIDSCFQFTYWFYDDEWFHQEDPAGPAGPRIWWVSICAIYDIGADPPAPWGWKTRPHYYEDDGVVITDYRPPAQPFGVGTEWVDGREIIWAPSGESYDLAFELFTMPDSCVDDGWRLKWSQPPEELVPGQDPVVYFGWDEPSTYTPMPVFPWPFVADDWPCPNTLPVGAIRWWGSYIGWMDHVPPLADIPVSFHLGIWTNVPADPNEPFSHPGTLVHEVFAPYEGTDERWVGYDQPPGVAQPIESCFEYTVCLDPGDWFHQRDPASPGDPPIWWLSVAAVYDDPAGVGHNWGWKTRPWFAEDDAVVTTSFWPIPLEIGGTWEAGYPIEDPFGASWDVAFELYAPPPCLMADFDHDGDVDLDDFGVFASCYNGSARPPAPTCPPGMNADLDGDGDVDLDDFGLFAACYTGAQ